MKNLILPLAVSLAAIACCAGAETSTTVPVNRFERERWKTRHEQKVEAARKGADLVFIGDSITEQWESTGSGLWKNLYGKRNVLNLGFGGDRTEHVLWRLQNGEFPEELDPKVAVLMIGTNNTRNNMTPAEDTAAGIRAILDLLREKRPEMKILLLGVFPRGETPDDPMRVRNREINEIIKDFGDGDAIHYLDISDVFLEEDGTISKKVMPDLLHLSDHAYMRWARAIEPKLRELGGFEEVDF